MLRCLFHRLCVDCTSNYKSNVNDIELYLKKGLQKTASTPRQRSEDSQWNVKQELNSFREGYIISSPTVTGMDISCGFPKKVVDEVVFNFTEIHSPEDVWQSTSVLNWDIACDLSNFVATLKRSSHLLAAQDQYQEFNTPCFP